MQNAGETTRSPVFFDKVEAVRPSLAAMDDEGQLGLSGERHLFAKDARLYLSRRVIVMIVEADLAPGDDAGTLRECCQPFKMLRSDFFRFVRVNSDGRVNPIVLLGERQRGV